MRLMLMGLVSGLVMVWAIALSLLYSSSARLVRLYERALKYIVWGIVLCFLWVVLNTETDWGGVLAGFVPFQFPESQSGISSLSIVVSGLAARDAVVDDAVAVFDKPIDPAEFIAAVHQALT